jgi:DNA modification methylase
MDFGDWDHVKNDWAELLKECYRVLKKGGTFISFYDLWKITELKAYLEKNKFKQIRLIEWLKSNPVPINSKVNYLTNSREVAVLGVKVGKPTFNSSYNNGQFSYPICQDKGRFHPTQKPLKLIKDLIEIHSNTGDTVLDCFAGAGTTAVACLHLNRDFVGCEINAYYVNKSLLRIMGEYSHGNKY